MRQGRPSGAAGEVPDSVVVGVHVPTGFPVARAAVSWANIALQTAGPMLFAVAPI